MTGREEQLHIRVYERQPTPDGFTIEAVVVIEGVPYFGVGGTIAAALSQLCDVLREHGAPVPGQAR